MSLSVELLKLNEWFFFAPMANRYVFHICKEHNTVYSVNRNSWRISCNWYLSHGFFLWSVWFLYFFLPLEFYLIASALVNLMKFYNDLMVIRNSEIGRREFKTLQTLILPLLSLHCHFTDANYLKWAQSLTSPKAIRFSYLVVLV